MSSTAGGPVVGVSAVPTGVGSVAFPLLGRLLAGVAVLAARGTVLAARGTVLAACGAATGVVLVGKQIRRAYLEHERAVEARLRRQQEVRARIEAAMRDLSVGLTRPATASVTAGLSSAEIITQVKAQVLNRFAEDRAIEAQLLKEVDEIALKAGAEANRGLRTSSQGTQAGTAAGVSTIRAAAAVDFPTIDAAARHRIDDAFKQGMLDEVERVLGSLPARQDLAARLGSLRAVADLTACQILLEEAYGARRALATQSAAGVQLEQLAGRVLGLRLSAESLRPLSEGERRQLRRAADDIERLLKTSRVSDGERKLQSQESRLQAYRSRDVGAWLSEEAGAREARHQAQALLSAMDEDAGFAAVIEQLKRSEDLSKIRRELDALDAQLLGGNFPAVMTLAKGLRERLEKFRDDALEAIRQEGIQAIVQVARSAMEARGFTDVQVTEQAGETGDACDLLGRRGETTLWVRVDGEPRLTFDLGRQGFVSQKECFAEIDALLKQFATNGLVFAIDTREGTLASGQTAADANTGLTVQAVPPTVLASDHAGAGVSGVETGSTPEYVHVEPQRVREAEG